MRRGPGSPYRRLVNWRNLAGRDRRAVLRFLRSRDGIYSSDRLRLLRACLRSTLYLRGYHTLGELLAVGEEILARRGRSPVVVECGVGKGSSTAKLSHFVHAAGGHLHAFDSFRGLPANEEVHENLDGRTVRFRSGAFRGRLAEVQRNVERFGVPEVVTLHKGWFADTLPAFAKPFDVALLDVDLLVSTRDCLCHLLPLRRPDGIVFSQDGHLRAICDWLGEPRNWSEELRSPMPRISGLGHHKFLRLDFVPEAGRPPAADRSG